MAIKKANGVDYRTLRPLFERFLLECGGAGGEAEIRKEFVRILSTGAMYFETDDSGTALGFICGMIVNPFWAGAPVAYEHLWYVAPEHRRSGMGARLVSEFETWARNGGCTAIVFEVNLFSSREPEQAKAALEKIGYSSFGYQMMRRA